MSMDRRASNEAEWLKDRPFVDLPHACYCLLKKDPRPCQPCVARLAVAEQGIGE